MSKVTWFEIPVSDIIRAKTFYEKVFDISIQLADMGPLKMGWFPEDESVQGANGSLVCHEDFYMPDREKGSLIYFNCEDLSIELGRVEDAGGEVVVEKKEIAPDVGYMGVFIDSEGNRIALHSKK